MNFREWCDHHNGDYNGAGSDDICEFGDWAVVVDRAHPSGGLVTVTKKSDPQKHDYRALEEDVEFTVDGIDGFFEGNISDTTDFDIETLKS
jgi:hypothetical protein